MSAVMQPARETFRPMRVEDISDVKSIEDQSYDFPWTVGIFRDCLRVGYRCRILDCDGDVAGYTILSVGADEAHILNLCVAPDFRGRGVGRRLLAHVVEISDAAGVGCVYLEVRPSNHAARRLYREAGFCEVGRRHNYYRAHHGREDAIVLRLRKLHGLPLVAATGASVHRALRR